MKAKATYYLKVDTYWANSPDWYCGPFPTPKKAWDEIREAIEDGLVTWPGHLAKDVRNGVRTTPPMSKTQALRLGMRPANILGTKIPRNKRELAQMSDLVAHLR